MERFRRGLRSFILYSVWIVFVTAMLWSFLP